MMKTKKKSKWRLKMMTKKYALDWVTKPDFDEMYRSKLSGRLMKAVEKKTAAKVSQKPSVTTGKAVYGIE